MIGMERKGRKVRKKGNEERLERRSVKSERKP